jgi:hypothetical protein
MGYVVKLGGAPRPPHPHRRLRLAEALRQQKQGWVVVWLVTLIVLATSVVLYTLAPRRPAESSVSSVQEAEVADDTSDDPGKDPNLPSRDGEVADDTESIGSPGEGSSESTPAPTSTSGE